MKKLPDAEFDVMRQVWSFTPPVTTAMLMETLGEKKGWKAQTLLTLLSRLTEKGFLRSEKNGKERSYWPLVGEEEYLRFETESFIRQYHNSSLASLVNALYAGRRLSQSEQEELRQLLERQGE